MQTCSLLTPVGRLFVSDERDQISCVAWHGQETGISSLLDEACRQITAYFSGGLQRFDLPLSVDGRDFQQRVNAAMLAIPFGETRTYGEIAQGLKSAAQPVGNACGANHLPILIPCHRVLGAQGLGGYSGSGGVETKVALLRHEGAGGLLI